MVVVRRMDPAPRAIRLAVVGAITRPASSLTRLVLARLVGGGNSPPMSAFNALTFARLM